MDLVEELVEEVDTTLPVHVSMVEFIVGSSGECNHGYG
jgi:hypothetical protein